MKTFVSAIASLCVLTLGCAKLDQKFTLNPDGSGSIWVQLELLPQAVDFVKVAPHSMKTYPPNIPWTEDAIRALADADNIQVKEARVEILPDGSQRLTAAVNFKDVVKLAKSKAASLFAFELTETAKGEVQFFAPPFGKIATVDYVESMIGNRHPEKIQYLVASQKLENRGVSYSLEASLPGTIVSSNANLPAAKTLSWSVNVDKLQEKDLPNVVPRAVFKSADLKFALPVRTFSYEDGYHDRSNADNIPAHPADENFGVVLDSIHLAKTVQFRNGKPFSIRQRVSGTLLVWYPQDIIPVSYENLNIEQATTDAGENILPEDFIRRSESATTIYNWQIRKNDGFNVHFSLVEAKLPFKSLTVFKGSLVLKYTSGSKTVTVPDARQWAGKKIDIPDIAGYKVKLERAADKSVTLVFATETKTMLKSVVFKDGAGAVLDSSEAPSYKEYVTYEVQLPQNGAIVFEFSQEVKKVTIPFELKNVPLEPEPEKLPF